MIINSPVQRAVAHLLAQLHLESVSPVLPSFTFSVVQELEGTLTKNLRADQEPIAAGWPPELAEQIVRLRTVEEQAAVEVRRLAIARALEPDEQRREMLSAHLREYLLRLLRCCQRERFLFLRAFWLDQGKAD